MRTLERDLEDTTKPYVEYLDGERHPKVSPRTDHMLVQTSCASVIGPLALANEMIGGTEWRVYPEGGDRTTSLVPDVSYISRRRLLELPEDQQQTPPFSPDLVIEVRSPSDRPAYIEKKVARYLRTGSALVLDINPRQRTVTAYSSSGSSQFTQRDTFRHAVMPWLTFEVAEIFRPIDEWQRRPG